ncbi:MAG: hypothetical protein AAGA48_10125 [Myxococcota bacterium]
MSARILPLLTCSTVVLWACSADGDVAVTVYGEDFVELGIPANEMADGWSVTFDPFIVTVDEVVVGGVEMPAGDPIDLSVETGGAGHPLAQAAVPTGDHTGSSFAITRIELAGSASKDGTTKTFDWVFDQRTDYSACETTTEVSEGGTATFQIAVHADHFFYDSLVAEEPQVVFQTLADSDADDDGTITRQELEAADIGSFDPGSSGEVNDLWTWLVAQSGTLGHVDGEGHCDSQD